MTMAHKRKYQETIEKMRAEDKRMTFTKKEAAAFFRKSLSVFNDIINREELPHLKDGRRLIFLKDDMYDGLCRLKAAFYDGGVEEKA
jgi:hypothetical protein